MKATESTAKDLIKAGASALDELVSAPEFSSIEVLTAVLPVLAERLRTQPEVDGQDITVDTVADYIRDVLLPEIQKEEAALVTLRLKSA